MKNPAYNNLRKSICGDFEVNALCLFNQPDREYLMWFLPNNPFQALGETNTLSVSKITSGPFMNYSAICVICAKTVKLDIYLYESLREGAKFIMMTSMLIIRGFPLPCIGHTPILLLCFGILQTKSSFVNNPNFSFFSCVVLRKKIFPVVTLHLT